MWKVGQKIKFRNQKKVYTIQACDERFAICNYPLNMIKKVRGGYEHEKTVVYTIIDLIENVRGPENLIFGFGAETREQCEEMLGRLNEKFGDGATEVSHRHRVPLDIEKIYD